jgi:DNA-binding NarL/FixJ family response regulator
MIRVAIADDHAIVREGLARILEAEDDMEVAVMLESGDDVLALAADADWDVLVLDLSLPGGGEATFEKLQYVRRGLPVIFFSMHPEDQYALQLLKAGAAAYLTKGRGSTEILSAIRKAAAGETYITQHLASQLLQAKPTQHQHAHELLTARERQVFVLLLEGKRPAEIVSELHVSPSTVSTHIQHIKKKLGVQSVVEMVKYAFRAGILD